MGSALGGATIAPAESVERITRLKTERQNLGADRAYVLGEGDVVSVHAFDFEQLNQRARVDGSGNIALPLLGTVPVAGHKVADVEKDLTNRLGEFMYDAHVSVFVEDYRSQRVAVIGAVQKPGLIAQTEGRSTVLDAIAAAGGMTAEAGSRVYLIPADGQSPGAGQRIALALKDQGSDAVDPKFIADAKPVMVDTKEVSEDAQGAFFNLPVMGGDVIVVPNGGHFIADGWFNKPGTYPLHSGLTVYGAIASAGGLHVAASHGSIRIYSAKPNGEGAVRTVNYNDIAALRAADVPIYDGDVIEASSSPIKVVPWGMYKVIEDLFHLGAGVKVAP
jgi:polysaccharide export outer membrane protein